MVRLLSLLHICLSSLCFIFCILPVISFVPSRLNWFSSSRVDDSSSDIPDDIALQNYHDHFRPINSYRTSMPLPVSRFINAFTNDDSSSADQYRSPFTKRGGIRLCGIRLMRKINQVCNKCIKSPDSSPVRKRSDLPDTTKLAEHCCSKGCEDSDFQQFCC